MKKKAKPNRNRRLHVRTGDLVKVITGSSKGVVGKILRIRINEDVVFVEGAAKAKKAVRPSQKHPEGGWIEIDRPIHLSNVKKLEDGVRPAKA